MPQKKNPDAAELVRAKIGRILGANIGLMTVMKGLPLAYSKDMQEDKEQVFDAADSLRLALCAMEGMIYAGVEFESNSDAANKLINVLEKDFGVEKIRFTDNCGIGIKPVSEEGSKRLIRKSFEYAIQNDRDSVSLIHKGNIQKFTEGAFRDWGYELARDEFDGEPLDGGPWHSFKNPNTGKQIIVKDVICDAFLQQILHRPAEYDVLAAPNLNGDYISDALAAQVGGIGIAPGANLGDTTAVFEATHGTAPKYPISNFSNKKLISRL